MQAVFDGFGLLHQLLDTIPSMNLPLVFFSFGQAESITFTIVQPPRHGAIERAARGQHFHLTSSFTMEDIYQNRVSYSHDGSNSLKDRFTFTVSDGTNPFFMIEEGGKEVRVGGGGRGPAESLRGHMGIVACSATILLH